MSFLIRQTLIYAVPLMIVALAGIYAERSGIINLALDLRIFGIEGKYTFHIPIATEIIVNKVLVVNQWQVFCRCSARGVCHPSATFDSLCYRGFSRTIITEEEINIGRLNVLVAILITRIRQINTDNF